MKKMMIVAAVAAVAAVSLCSCGSVTYTNTKTETTTNADGTQTTVTTTTDESGKKTTVTSTTEEDGTQTTTEVSTDADGNEMTFTTTEYGYYPEGSCGEAAEDEENHTVDISLENATGGDITGIYMCESGATEWHNLMDEDQYLGDGSIAYDYLHVTYNSDALSYDLGIVDEDGEMHEFDGIDISDLDEDGFTITLNKTDNGYTWTIDKSYVKA